MSDASSESRQAQVARDYFRLLDAGDLAIFELFTDDFSFYFPKFGLGRGREQMLALMQGLGAVVKSTRHDASTYRYLHSGDHLVVEGTTSGVAQSGATWAAGETPTGRFCNVFEFRDGRIARLAVYLDPDYEGRNEAGFLWGRDGRTW